MTIETELPAVKVKALNWAPYSAGMFFAPCVVGDYLVHPKGHWWLKGENTHEAGSIGEAKAAAQADYEQRILSAINPAAITASLAEARADALEEAAQAVELKLTSVLTTDTVAGRGLHRLDGAIIRELAAAIRALKSGGANG